MGAPGGKLADIALHSTSSSGNRIVDKGNAEAAGSRGGFDEPRFDRRHARAGGRPAPIDRARGQENRQASGQRECRARSRVACSHRTAAMQQTAPAADVVPKGVAGVIRRPLLFRPKRRRPVRGQTLHANVIYRAWPQPARLRPILV